MTVASVDHAAEGNRRDFLFLATGAAAAVGAAATVWPFISQLAPDASTVSAGAPVELDMSSIASGAQIKILWRGKPYFVRNRTDAEIKAARDVDITTLRDPETDQHRVKEGHDKWLITAANCTHLGCVPLGNQGDYGGWLCPCHGSHFDTSGRIRKGPAPKNLPVPQYNFVSDARIRITGAAATA
ncbi:MAG: ubiquinol-cytochrome c reductase iron-sulfur subunit [Rhizobiales bacterium]|nr:ubiquinol-cytochrome c reductase iron-sulfur subunit [Hyphomicrobiales bacterium]